MSILNVKRRIFHNPVEIISLKADGIVFHDSTIAFLHPEASEIHLKIDLKASKEETLQVYKIANLLEVDSKLAILFADSVLKALINHIKANCKLKEQ